MSGSAFYRSPRAVKNGFYTRASFKITASGSGGDGMAFVIHDDPAGESALGAGRRGHGCCRAQKRGCTLWVDAAAVPFGFPVAGPQVVLPIPYDPAFFSADLYFQFADITPSGNFLGVADLSNALGIKIGGPL